jgi:hypothetical protein
VDLTRATKAGKSAKEVEDPFHLRRFQAQHRSVLQRALTEIETHGRKSTHWMWYLCPTPPFVLGGKERGIKKNREYALRDPWPRELDGFLVTRAYLD